MMDTQVISRVSVERRADGLYVLRDAQSGRHVVWDPRRGLLRGVRFPSNSFKRHALKLRLGVACRGCGYLYFEHNIDGDDRAPCNEFHGVVVS